MAQSEVVIAAVPTAADSWTTVGTFTVPAGVKRMMKLRVMLNPDWGTTAGSVRTAPVFRLIGSGLLEQSPHVYLGNFGGHAEVTTGGISNNSQPYDYDTDIPVQTGGTFDAQVNTLDEAVTAGTCQVNAFYDNEAAKLKNNMADWVDAALTTTADAWSTVGTFTVPQPGAASAPKRIREVILGVARDEGTSAISVRLSSRFRLSGSGINEGGTHEFLGPGGFAGEIGSSPSQGISQDNGTVRIKVDIPVNAGGAILAEQRLDVETPAAGTAAVGLVYSD